jgi:hypothetical protein
MILQNMYPDASDPIHTETERHVVSSSGMMISNETATDQRKVRCVQRGRMVCCHYSLLERETNDTWVCHSKVRACTNTAYRIWY